MSNKLTNKLGLPESVCRAVANDPYSKGESDYSATELLKPPRQRRLQKDHADEIEEDVSERIWSLFGQLGHLLIERAGGNEVSEVRLFKKIDDKIISAQIDNLCLEKNILSDFKFTTAWAFKTGKPPKDEFIQQMNIQKYLLEENGYSEIKKLQIIGILRDWHISDSRQYDDYPKFQVAIHDIPIWSKEQTLAFIKLRIAAHESAKKELPDCSPGEMWEKPTTWAVRRKGVKRAVKVLTKEEDAVAICEEFGSGYEVVKRLGSRDRCLYYCSASKFCDQHKKLIKEEL